MPALEIKLLGDGAFRELQEHYGAPIHLANDAIIQIAGLEGGTVGGKPTVAFAFVLPERDTWVLAETTLALFLTAADTLRARFGDPRT